MDLDTFLRRHQFNTSAQVTSLRWTGDHGLVVSLDCYPFWLPEASRENRKRLDVSMHGIVESSIDLAWDEAELEDLTVSDEDPLLWHHGSFGAIFGCSPLVEPHRFLSDYLKLCERLGNPRDPIQYLNADRGLATWTDTVQHTTYELLCAPVPIYEAVQGLLPGHCVEFSAVLGPAVRHNCGQKVVWLGQSWVVCSLAEAIVLDAGVDT